MRVKVFKAADLKEAMAMVKDEMGRDAVILHTKRYRQGGFLGYKSKEVVEVTAAVEDDPQRTGAKIPPMPRTELSPGFGTSEPASKMPAMTAQAPRQVLAQYKTAGTAEGVSLAESATASARGTRQAASESASFLDAQRGTSAMKPQPMESYSMEPIEATRRTRRIAQTRPVRPASAVRARKPAAAYVPQQAYTPSQSYKPYESASYISENELQLSEEKSAKAAVKPKRGYDQPILRTSSKTEENPRLIKEQPETLSKKESPAKPTEDVAPEHTNDAGEEKIQALEDELAQMRLMLKQVMGQPRSENEIVTLQDALKAQDVSEQVMQDVIRKISPAVLLTPKKSEDAVKALTEYLRTTIKTGDGIGLRNGRPKIVALIGTTGVGKTTTIAKIAARFVLERGISVALITADTYRISAVDQLKTYSDIIGLPLEIVYSAAELKPALRKHKDKQLILIDTAGRSQNNEYQMQELQEFLSVDPSIEKHIVMSATTKERDAEGIIDRFSVCKPDRIIFTKTDETDSLGFIINLLYDRRIALSYLTNGQSVPDDIEPARAEALAKLLLR